VLGSIKLLRPGKDEVALNAVTNKVSHHGNTTMFDLGTTQESNGSLLAHLIKISLRESHGVLEFDKGIKLSSKLFRVYSSLRKLNGCSVLRIWNKCQRDSSKSGGENCCCWKAILVVVVIIMRWIRAKYRMFRWDIPE
jgi:hypothetical protein